MSESFGGRSIEEILAEAQRRAGEAKEQHAQDSALKNRAVADKIKTELSAGRARQHALHKENASLQTESRPKAEAQLKSMREELEKVHAALVQLDAEISNATLDSVKEVYTDARNQSLQEQARIEAAIKEIEQSIVGMTDRAQANQEHIESLNAEADQYAGTPVSRYIETRRYEIETAQEYDELLEPLAAEIVKNIYESRAQEYAPGQNQYHSYRRDFDFTKVRLTTGYVLDLDNYVHRKVDEVRSAYGTHRALDGQQREALIKKWQSVFKAMENNPELAKRLSDQVIEQFRKQKDKFDKTFFNIRDDIYEEHIKTFSQTVRGSYNGEYVELGSRRKQELPTEVEQLSEGQRELVERAIADPSLSVREVMATLGSQYNPEALDLIQEDARKDNEKFDKVRQLQKDAQTVDYSLPYAQERLAGAQSVYEAALAEFSAYQDRQAMVDAWEAFIAKRDSYGVSDLSNKHFMDLQAILEYKQKRLSQREKPGFLDRQGRRDYAEREEEIRTIEKAIKELKPFNDRIVVAADAHVARHPVDKPQQNDFKNYVVSTHQSTLTRLEQKVAEARSEQERHKQSVDEYQKRKQEIDTELPRLKSDLADLGTQVK